MLLPAFLFCALFTFYPAHAQFLMAGSHGNISDIQYLHMLLAEEKQIRMQLQSQVVTLQTAIYDLKDRVAELEGLEGKSCGLYASTCPTTPTVAFMAQLNASITDPAQGQTVIFNQIETNKGNAYNPINGVFTAPFNGTYNFNVIVSAPPAPGGHWLHLFIKKNKAQVGYVFLDDNDKYWLRRSTDVTVHLLQGDEVCVDVDMILGSHTIGGCCFHTHFSGFLIGID